MRSTHAEIEEAESSQRHPFPTELVLWTVDDVCRWLDTLQLGEYKQAFREGKVCKGVFGTLTRGGKRVTEVLLAGQHKISPPSPHQRYASIRTPDRGGARGGGSDLYEV